MGRAPFKVSSGHGSEAEPKLLENGWDLLKKKSDTKSEKL